MKKCTKPWICNLGSNESGPGVELVSDGLAGM